MEHEFDLQALPDPAAIIVVASCENKNALRQTCKRFGEFASRRKNENILKQPQLYLIQEALDRYLLYYGALGNVDIVSNLLAKGANPNATEDNGTTLMHHAIRCGYKDIENMLLEHPALIENDTFILNPFSSLQFDQSSIDRMCPLCVLKAEKLIFNAIEKGSYSAVEYFLSLNVSANAKNKEGENALYYAARVGYLNIMKLLINKGANLNGIPGYDKQRHYQSFMPLQVASQKGRTSAVQLLIDYNVAINRYGSYHFQRDVGECGYVQILKMLLAQGAEFDDKDWLLYDAAHKGYTQLVKVLLENGVTMNKRRAYNNGGKYWYDVTPLDVAGNQEVRNLLRAYSGKSRAELENCIVQ